MRSDQRRRATALSLSTCVSTRRVRARTVRLKETILLRYWLDEMDGIYLSILLYYR